MRLKTTKIKFPEKAIKMALRENIDPHKLDVSQKRVWNNLDYLITKEPKFEKSVVFLDQKLSWSIWGYLISLSFVILLLFSIFAILRLFKTMPQIDDSGLMSANKPDIDTIKKVAASRFQEINGFTFEEFRDAIVNQNNSQNSDLLVSGDGRTAEFRLDPKKAEDLYIKAQSRKQKIYYSSQEIQIHNQEEAIKQSLFGLGIGKNPNIDYTQKIKYENWITTGYSKTLITQNDKVIALYLVKPDSYIMYLGGEYAVEQKYDYDNIVVAGISADGEIIKNPEIELLKKILTENDLDEAELIKENSIKLIKIKIGNFAGIFGKSNLHLDTFFFLNQDNLLPVKYEQYTGNTLIATITYQTSEQNQESVDEVINIRDLKEKEVKTINIQKGAVPHISQEKSIVEFIQKYPILTIIDNKKIQDIVAFDFHKQKEHDFLGQLINSSKFNPLYNDIVKENEALAGYSSQNTNIRVNIYKSKPKFILDDTSDYDIEVEPIKVKVDSKSVEAEYYIRAPKKHKSQNYYTDSSQKLIDFSGKYNGLILEYNQLWYDIKANSYTKEIDHRFASDLEIKVLSDNQAAEIDNINAEKLEAEPRVEFVELSKIPSRLRYLPGDLKEYNLEARFSGQSVRDGNENCDKYFLTTPASGADCLTEKFNGVVIKFNRFSLVSGFAKEVLCLPFNSCDEEYFYYIVTEQPKDKVELIFADLNLDYKVDITGTNNLTMVILSNLSDENIAEIKSKIAKDKDIEEIQNQIKKNRESD